MVSCVLDTVIFVRCLVNPVSYSGRIVFGPNGRYDLFTSTAIVSEVSDVINRPALARKFREIGGLDREAVMRVLAVATYVEPSDVPIVARDPKDDIFLAVAVAAGADYLVSEDNDLLVIGEYEGVRIVDAATFLTILESQDAPN